MPRPCSVRVVLTQVVAVLLGACSGAGGGRDGLPDAAERHRSALEIREVAASTPDGGFTDITAVDVDSRGRVYVGDWYRQQVTILGPDGSVVRRVGGRGEGPGEFKGIRGVQILPGDSLLVYDPSLVRVSIYAPDSVRPAYVAGLGARLRGGAPFYLWRNSANDGYVALFRPGFAFMGGRTESRRSDALRLLALDGAPRVTLVEFPSKGFLVAETSITPNPFGREGLAAEDSRGTIRYLWNDSLAVETFSADGRRVGRTRLAHQPPPVTREQVQRHLSGMSEWSRTTFGRVLEDSVPERWPAASALLVDDRDRSWVALAGDPTHPGEWIVLSAEGRYLASVLFPPRVTPRAAAGGLVYAQRLSEDDVPSIVTYRVSGLPE